MTLKFKQLVIFKNRKNLAILLLSIFLSLCSQLALAATTRIYHFRNPTDIAALLQDALAGRIDPNYAMDNGLTPLMVTAYQGDVENTNNLLAIGADPTKTKDGGHTPLMLAAEEGHIKIVDILLKHHVDPNIANDNGWTALMSASFNGYVKIAQSLLDYGANPNQKNNFGVTSVNIALQKKHPAIVELFRARKAIIGNQSQALINFNLRSYLQNFSSSKNLALKEFQEENGGLCHGFTTLWLYYQWLNTQHKNSDDWFDSTIKKISRWDGIEKLTATTSLDFEKLATLINNLQTYEAQCNPEKALAANQLDTGNQALQKKHTLAASFTPQQLFAALTELLGNNHHDDELIYIHFPDHVTGLFKHEENYYYYDPNEVNGQFATTSITALADFIFHNNQEHNYSKNFVVGIAIYSFKEKALPYPPQQELLNKIQPAIDSSALTAAAYIDCLESLTFLLAHGANPNTLTWNHLTPLMVASERSHVAIINKLLADKQIDPNQIDHEVWNSRGYTALMYAAQHGQLAAVVRLLADQRVTPNQENPYNGMNALMCAAKYGHAATVDKLLPVTNDPNKPCGSDETALILAAQHGHLQAVKRLLLDPRIKIDQVTSIGGKTALMYASYYGHAAVVEELLKKGADPKKQDHYHDSAIDFATQKNHQDCLEILKKYQHLYEEL